MFQTDYDIHTGRMVAYMVADLFEPREAFVLARKTVAVTIPNTHGPHPHDWVERDALDRLVNRQAAFTQFNRDLL